MKCCNAIGFEFNSSQCPNDQRNGRCQNSKLLYNCVFSACAIYIVI